ncbi:hypothetical protein NBRC116494_23490 [Aurantivibrio plasticivorans]
MLVLRNSHSQPPLTGNLATAFVSRAQTLWNQGDAEQLVQLFAPHCDWYSCNQTLLGQQALFQSLQDQFKSRSHCQVALKLRSHSFTRLSIDYQAYRQDSKNLHGKRGNGSALVQLNSNGLISELKIVGSQPTPSHQTLTLSVRPFVGGGSHEH